MKNGSLAFLFFILSPLLLAGGPGHAESSEEQLRQDSEERFLNEIQRDLRWKLITESQAKDKQSRYQFYRLMAAANAAGNTDDVLPRLVITVAGPRIGGLVKVRYAAQIPDSGEHSEGIVTTGWNRESSFAKRPIPVEGEGKIEVEIPSVRASACTREHYRRVSMPFLNHHRCDERVPVVVWLEFGYETDLYFFSQDVMNACETPEKDFPLDLRAYRILGAKTGADIVSKAAIRCEKSRKTAAIHIETDPGWGR